MQRRRDLIQLDTLQPDRLERLQLEVTGSRDESSATGYDHRSEIGVTTVEPPVSSRHDSSSSPDATIDDANIPSADRGLGAWLILASSFLLQLPIWGFSQTFGIFQDYYMNQDIALQGDRGSVPVIGATCNGIMYLLSPISFAILTKFPHLRPYCNLVGLVLALIGFIASSFADQVWQLVLTQGVLSGLGCGLLFAPITLYLNEWFIQKKGLAVGIMWAGKSGIGVGLPLAAQASVAKYGPQTTLRAWAILVALVTIPVLRFIRPRLPIEHGRRPRLLGDNFLRMGSFWVFHISNIVQGLGYFVPSNYIFSYATNTLGYPAYAGTLMLSSINASSVIGGIILGMLCDRFPVHNIILLSSVGSALAVLIFWGLSASATTSSAVSSYATMALFTTIYGFFAGGWSSVWSGVMVQIKREAPGVESGLMFGLLSGSRGIGTVISGPIAAALLNKGTSLGSSLGSSGWIPGYDTQYGGVILFTGITALAGACSWFWHASKVCVHR